MKSRKPKPTITQFWGATSQHACRVKNGELIIDAVDDKPPFDFDDMLAHPLRYSISNMNAPEFTTFVSRFNVAKEAALAEFRRTCPAFQ